MSNASLTGLNEPRKFGFINWLGLWTLYKKEVRRFLKVYTQTVAAPVATTLLYMTVFAVAIGSRRGDVNGIPFIEFLAPGLILMGLLNNAFANSGSSILVSKVQGNAVDFLMPPLSALPRTPRSAAARTATPRSAAGALRAATAFSGSKQPPLSPKGAQVPRQHDASHLY